MRTDEYAPGYSAPMVSFMAQRTAEAHAGFFLPHLQPGSCVLDAGCGPGTITLGLARKIAPGHVIGIDVEDSQFEQARAVAKHERLDVEFRRKVSMSFLLGSSNSMRSFRMRSSSTSAIRLSPLRSFAGC